MAEKKETPRQKMIGMMYLVLTALLAMNVSKKVLMGFVTVNESLERSNKTFSESTQTMMKYFLDYVKVNPSEKYYYNKAEEAEKISGDMYIYVEQLKKKLVEITESRTKQQADTAHLRFVNALDNYDIPTYELFGDNEADPTQGAMSAFELRNKLNETHDKILKLFEGKDIKKKFLASDLEVMRKKISGIKPVDPDTKYGDVKENWQMYNFYHLPLAAVITNLSKIQSDLKNLESETINTIAKSVMTTIPKIDEFNAAVIAPTNYVQVGEKYQSEIFLATGSSNVKREVFIGDFDTVSKIFRGDYQQLKVDASGKAIFEQNANAQGEKKYKGVIKMTKETGEIQYFPFEQKYTVAPSSVAVSPDNMNVVYAGIDNPVSVSAAGIAPQNLRVNTDKGSISSFGSPGKFNIKVMSGDEVTVTVSAQTEAGIRTQGTAKFRIKRLPAPSLKIDGKGGNGDNKVTPGEMSVARYLNAGPENFQLTLKYKIKDYSVLIISGNKGTSYQGKGNILSDEIRKRFIKLKKGDAVAVDAVVISPDNREHSVNTILKIK